MERPQPAPLPLLAIRGLSWRFPLATAPALGPVDLDVLPGEVVLLAGPTGSGKSTLLRLAAGILGRHGHGAAGGTVRVEGRDPASLAPSERVSIVGFVAQEPRDQVITGTLGDEVAFGPESAGWSAHQVEARIPEMLATFGLPADPGRSTGSLSGGEQQRLLVAASLAARARLLLLDEPLAQLDPTGARDVVAHLAALAGRGVAVLVAEHRLEACWSACHRVVVLDGGRIVSDTARDGVPFDLLRGLGLALPGLGDLEDRLAARGLALEDLRARHLPSASSPVLPASPGPPALTARDLVRTRDGRVVARLAALDLAPGARVALLGANGAGKTSLLEALAGESDHGRVDAAGPVLIVPQDPDLTLFCETVEDELAYGPREAGLTAREVTERVSETAEALSEDDLLARPPQALSRGQRLRVAVAASLACRPAVLLLDEPTSGQDRDRVDRMMEALSVALAGGALVFATHDVDLALRHATRVLLVEGGAVVQDGTPSGVAAALRARGTLPALAALCVDLGLPPCPAADLAALLA